MSRCAGCMDWCAHACLLDHFYAPVCVRERVVVRERECVVVRESLGVVVCDRERVVVRERGWCLHARGVGAGRNAGLLQLPCLMSTWGV